MENKVTEGFIAAYTADIIKIVGQDVQVDIKYIPHRTCWLLVASTVIGNRDIKVEQWTDIYQLENISPNGRDSLIRAHAGSIKRDIKIARFSKGFKNNL